MVSRQTPNDAKLTIANRAGFVVCRAIFRPSAYKGEIDIPSIKRRRVCVAPHLSILKTTE